jgi:hypothetical protein
LRIPFWRRVRPSAACGVAAGTGGDACGVGAEDPEVAGSSAGESSVGDPVAGSAAEAGVVEVAEDPEERDPTILAAEGVGGVSLPDWRGDAVPTGNCWRGAGREAKGNVVADAARLVRRFDLARDRLVGPRDGRV